MHHSYSHRSLPNRVLSLLNRPIIVKAKMSNKQLIKPRPTQGCLTHSYSLLRPAYRVNDYRPIDTCVHKIRAIQTVCTSCIFFRTQCLPPADTHTSRFVLEPDISALGAHHLAVVHSHIVLQSDSLRCVCSRKSAWVRV